MSAPVVTVFAIAEPEIDPMAAEAMTLALAGPPRNRPAAAKARSMKKRPAPVTSRNAPKRTKMNTVPAAIPSGVPNRPAPVKIWKRRMRSRVKPRFAITSGSRSPNPA